MLNKVLITGGAGFIGSNLCSHLLKNNFTVYCIDNLITGSFKNIGHLDKSDRFIFIKEDVLEKIDINVNYIFNFACPASPIQYQKNPIKTMKTSILGIYNVIELAQKYNAHLIHASTSEIYGDPIEHPQSEDYWGNVNPVGSRSCYVEGKRCCESIIYDYVKSENLSASIVRIFNTYGPNMAIDDGRVVSNFIINALSNTDITIYGDGKQTRSFCYIDDMINFFDKLLSYKILGPINAGSTNEISILELAQIIIDKTNSNSNIIFNNLPEDDPARRKPNIDKAINEMMWKPNIDLSFGITETINYFKRIMSESNTAKN